MHEACGKAQELVVSQSISSTISFAGLSWPLIVASFTYLALLFNGADLLNDGDTYWHIAAGRWMIEHWAIPHQDPFSHSLSGTPWTAHEWLAEIILAVTYNAGGWAGVVVLTTFAFASALAIQTRFLLKYLEPIHALMFAALALLLTGPHLLARPHVLAIPLMVWWVANLVQASEEQRVPSFWLLPVMTLWANLHGGFTLGLALALAFAVESILNAHSRSERVTTARKWLVFWVLSLVSALITPHGIKGLLFTFHILSQSYQLDVINEWRSPDFHDFQPLELWLLTAFAASLYAGLRLPVLRLLLVLGLIHLALKHARSVELLGLLAPLFLAAPLARQWYAGNSSKKQLQSVDRFFHGLAKHARGSSVAITLACLALISIWLVKQDTLRPREHVAPVAAIQEALKANLSGPVFNEYHFGGYLIFSGIAPFIDGRADMYGDDFLKKHREAINLKSADRLLRILKNYRIEWTLLEPEIPAVGLLDHLPNWQRFYTDKAAVIHVRKPVLAEEQRP